MSKVINGLRGAYEKAVNFYNVSNCSERLSRQAEMKDRNGARKVGCHAVVWCYRQGTSVTQFESLLHIFTGTSSVFPSDIQPSTPQELSAVQQGSRAGRHNRQ